MVTLFSCIGVHAFRYWSAPVVVNHGLAAMIAHIIQGTANGYIVCHGHHREVLSLATVSQKARSHALQSILACPRKRYVPFFVDSHVVCMVGSFIHRSCNMRIIGLGYNRFQSLMLFVVYSLMSKAL